MSVAISSKKIVILFIAVELEKCVENFLRFSQITCDFKLVDQRSQVHHTLRLSPDAPVGLDIWCNEPFSRNTNSKRPTPPEKKDPVDDIFHVN